MRTRSPFPGMDPWLESYWGDVHHTIISTLRKQIFGQLPAGLFAAIEQNVYVVEVEPERQFFRPDVGVFDTGIDGREGRENPDNAGVALAEPVRLSFLTEPVTEGHIEIRELRSDHPLVTVIEVLSPTNKMDLRGRAAYIAKRTGYMAANVNIVELDLLRGGDHLIGVPPEYMNPPSMAPYKCAVRHSTVDPSRTNVDYFPLSMRQRLPRISIPLRQVDAPIVIDLQEPIEVAFEEGGFALRIDYKVPPQPSLSADDAAWAAGLF